MVIKFKKKEVVRNFLKYIYFTSILLQKMTSNPIINNIKAHTIYTVDNDKINETKGYKRGLK